MTTETAPVEQTAVLTLYLSRDFERDTDRDRAALEAWLTECERDGCVAAELPTIDVASVGDVDELQDLFESDLNGVIVVVSGKVERR